MRLQDAKTKLFDTNGTILEPRWTDSQEIVSYIIRTDKGKLTTRHRKYIRQLEPENDPTITNKNIFTNLDTPAADPDILESVEIEQKATERFDSADDTTEKVGQRRSGRIKAKASLKGISKIKVRKVIVSPKSVTMGQSCSSQLKEAQAKNKQLEGRIRLYEKGITDKSIHASQTNFGLLTIASEDNSECDCKSGSMVGIIEIIAILLVTILLIYILYCCCVCYHTRRQAGREKRKGKIMSEMETRMGRATEGNRNLAIEMASSSPSAPCGREHLHVPPYHNNQTGFQIQNSNPTESRGIQQDATFSNWVLDHYSPVNRIILQ